MSDFTPCLTYAALPLTLPFLLLFAGWSWLEREGKRMEKEAEGLRAVRSRIVAECGDDDEDSDGKRNGFGKGDGGMKRPEVRRVRSWRELIEDSEQGGEEIDGE